MFTLSQIIQGYTLYAQARQLSPHTLADYHNTFRKLASFLETDLPFDKITKTQLERFLAIQTVSKKTLLNYHTGLSALWRWAVEEGYAIANLPRQIDPPKPGRRSINPFSDQDLRAIMNAVSLGKTYQNRGTLTANRMPNKDRNRAIILLLLDTGLRVEELCDLQIRDVDLQNRFVHVASGKGDSERFVPFSPRTAQSLWKYLALRSRGGSQIRPYPHEIRPLPPRAVLHHPE
jgi:site-specific recombinase XerD